MTITKTFQLTINYRFEANGYMDAGRKARDLGLLDESDEIEINSFMIHEVKVVAHD